MKNAKKVTRLKLDGNHSVKLILLGLVSAEPDYKLALLINRKLKVFLRNINPLAIPAAPAGNIHFSRFSYTDAGSGTVYQLIANRSDREPLLKHFEKLDYIFSVHDPVEESRDKELASILRDTESVTAVFPIDHETIRDKNLKYLIN